MENKLKINKEHKYKLNQIGFVVKDIQRISSHFQNLMGIGSLKVVEWPIPGIDPESTHRGKKASWKMLLGFVEADNITMEFIQPLEGASIFSEHLLNLGSGLHHLRFSVLDFDGAVRDFIQNGYEMIASGNGVHYGSRWAFFDTRADFEGLIIELRTDMDQEEEKNKWIK